MAYNCKMRSSSSLFFSFFGWLFQEVSPSRIFSQMAYSCKMWSFKIIYMIISFFSAMYNLYRNYVAQYHQRKRGNQPFEALNAVCQNSLTSWSTLSPISPGNNKSTWHHFHQVHSQSYNLHSAQDCQNLLQLFNFSSSIFQLQTIFSAMQIFPSASQLECSLAYGITGKVYEKNSSSN